MNGSDFARLFERDLKKLQGEVNLYPDDASLWKGAPGITNSGGTLVLHLCGNLRHFVGNEIGRSGYVRDRDAEFSTRGLTKNDLNKEIELTIKEVMAALESLPEAKLDNDFPKEISGVIPKTGFALLHLYGHLDYHLGQINYHRRITS